jgi:hypothetical protein
LGSKNIILAKEVVKLMEKKPGRISNKETVFYAIYVLLLLLESWPGLFLGNRAEPFILGMPFFLFYQLMGAFITVGFFVLHFCFDSRDGELDYEVDPDYDYLKDKGKYF